MPVQIKLQHTAPFIIEKLDNFLKLIKTVVPNNADLQKGLVFFSMLPDIHRLHYIAQVSVTFGRQFEDLSLDLKKFADSYIGLAGENEIAVKVLLPRVNTAMLEIVRHLKEKEKQGKEARMADFVRECFMKAKEEHMVKLIRYLALFLSCFEIITELPPSAGKVVPYDKSTDESSVVPPGVAGEQLITGAAENKPESVASDNQ